MKSTGHPIADRRRISVPGVSLVVLFVTMSLLLAFLFAWLSRASPPVTMLAALLVAAGWFIRTTVVSLFAWNALLVVSDGTRDSYVPASDIVEVRLGATIGPFCLLTVAYQNKGFFGQPWIKRVRTLVWTKTAPDAREEIERLLSDPTETPNLPRVPFPAPRPGRGSS